ncbi:PIN domain-containing protein [Parapedobacter pyrenivorans]|uniref:PIN domain-containing protein n=1 Tax=Parapedobacter pyrenivorans TaxID=1305674 RepID=A0A917M6Y3_9SPHI|nr:putative toxin-antitoxin system toxin component, PIN family [Parapedobacter pyrenivorans]GGG81337.1 PIN domain-containing protein [Parapedobacter pyrenivorans]
MKRAKLFIFDVNTLISAFVIGSQTNAKAFDRAISIGRIITSPPIQSELSNVFLRPKFDRFVSLEDRLAFLTYLDRQMLSWSLPISAIQASRDPKDDKYLELGVAAEATCIITGDNDLLILHPFHNIPILSAADFLIQF